MKEPKRKRYANLARNSPVEYFEAGSDFIRVWFEDGAGYEYDARNPGLAHVDAMRVLAERGQGLAAYISKHVRKRYAHKL